MGENMHEFLLRVKTLFGKQRLYREMNEELEFHQAMLRTKLLREGVPEAEVGATARRRFGNQGRWEERLREMWQFKTLENMGRDLRYAARVLSNSPGFTAVAVLTLALGVGANTTVFSMVNGLLLRPLPTPESARLAVFGIDQGRPELSYSFPEPIFRGLERKHETFEHVFAFNHAKMLVQGRDGKETISGQFVSGEFFAALETAPLMGRILTPADDKPGGDPAGFGVVIGEQFWETWFGRSADVVGRKLQIDNTIFTVVGVMPKRFIGADPLSRPQLFVPLGTEPILNGHGSMVAAGFSAWWLNVMGRLRPGSTLEQANAQMKAASGPLLHEVIPDAGWVKSHEQHFQLVVQPGSTGFTYIRMFFRKPLMAVFAMCGGILLLACLNLASLLMARGEARQRELATRLALGASRLRLLQQLMVESLLLAFMGTAAGLVVAPMVSKSLAALLLGSQSEAHVDTSLDIRVFAFAALASVVATLLIGLVPALWATRKNLSESIKDGQHASQPHERRRILPRMLMATEVGLALVLVVGAGLLASSLVRLYESGEGFDPRGVENITMSMDKQGLKGDALTQFYRELGDGLRRQPGVEEVSFARIVPMTNFVWDQDFSTGAEKGQDTYMNSVSGNYFKTMRIPLLAGRDFDWNDTVSSGAKIILNQAAAKLLFPDGNVLGRTVKNHDGGKLIPYEVVGVVGDAKYEDLRSAAPPAAYVAMTQENDVLHSPSYTAVVRTDGPAGPLAGAARALSTKLSPGVPTPVMTSMMSVVDDSLSAERMMALLAVFFAACALMVTAVGLYGTLAYATARRTSEIGIRMALGAQKAQVVRMVFAENAGVALAGTAVGLGAALLGSKVLASFLYGTSVRDPWVFAGSILALALIAVAASLLPALRAARIEPMAAIRCG